MSTLPLCRLTDPAIPRDLALLQQARTCLAAYLPKCQDLGEVQSIHVQAKLLEHYLKEIGESLPAQNAATEITIRVKRRIGELLRDMPKHPGILHSGGNTVLPPDDVPPLADLGISKMESSRYQAIAAIPAEPFEEHVGWATSGDRELTTKAVVKLGRSYVEESRRREACTAALASHPDGDGIHTGDLSLLDDLVPDGSADLFFTDPPYHEDKTDLFGRLAELASRKLKPGCLCLAYCGQANLPEWIDAMRRHLEYWWMFSIHLSGGFGAMWSRGVEYGWRPVLVFARPPIRAVSRELCGEMTIDCITGGGRDKAYHEWGQDAAEATYWIEKLSPPGGLVVDPFCGGGAIPAACKATGRRWIATELNPEHAATARSRVAREAS
jgi:site-specific DNA-methyltransferase (adenine-specific)